MEQGPRIGLVLLIPNREVWGEVLVQEELRQACCFCAEQACRR